ncbi:FAD-binding protein [Petrotoga sp. HWH.PT.55.6.1]|jgi:glycolate oxidase|uniref:FAD-binding oxidoreductase n=1 Tax=unclassified Petrotoga TaxID=2620614 RepID=UPI000CA03349|nr:MULTISPECIES: FAD-binding oxidoreductase [unclassified Petrotoga]PNR88601.1 FAD-binding protein [Petrotoga sp. 9T1HF07.CasAA.8.2]PNR92633.1 FAD-binding protein [Petrotoga sp. HWHPT.55.6.3]RPD36553.1 FAD-binding protein [Petrotoga sp. HWH.PT.55.6.1]
MSEYRKVTTNTVEKLRKILKNDALLIYDDTESLKSYSNDESGGEYYAHMPDVVVKPETKEQISQIIKLANDEMIPITPRGAGSGLAGADIPIFGGIVISLERMNRIIEIDSENLVAVVEPGVVTNDLCRIVSEKGLYYAGYPMSVETSFIGGNVATNAGGSKVIKYGNTSHHILGLEVVMPDGEIVEYGGKRRKDSSGYNLLQLFIGSEGTLGIFTKIYVNLIPQPGKVVDLLVPFESVEKAISNVAPLMVETKSLPSGIEFIDKKSIYYASKYTGMKLPYQDEVESYLIVQYEATSLQEIEELYEKGGKALQKNGAKDVFIADNRSNSEKIWRMRRNWLESLKAVDPYVPTGDVVVPTSKIPEMMTYINEVANEFNIDIPVAGHAADGNLHPAPLKPKNLPPNEWKTLSEEILGKIAMKAAQMGGAISGEHGVGFIKKELLKKTKPKQYKWMQEVKETLDPNNIMNPGKLF